MGRRKHNLVGRVKNDLTVVEDHDQTLVVIDTAGGVRSVNRQRFLSGTVSRSMNAPVLMTYNPGTRAVVVRKTLADEWWKAVQNLDNIVFLIKDTSSTVLYHPSDVVTRAYVEDAFGGKVNLAYMQKIFRQAVQAGAEQHEAEMLRQLNITAKVSEDGIKTLVVPPRPLVPKEPEPKKLMEKPTRAEKLPLPHIPKGFKFFTITPEDIPDPDAPVELTEQTQGVWTAGDLNGDIATPEMLAQGVEELKKQVEQLTQKAITDPEAAAKEVERLAQEAKDFLNDPDGADTPSLLAPLLPVPVLTEKEKEEQAWLQQMNEESKIIAQQNLQRQAEEKRLRTPNLRI